MPKAVCITVWTGPHYIVTYTAWLFAGSTVPGRMQFYLPEERVILTTDMEEDQDAADQEHDLHGADGSIFEINDFTNATPWER